MHTPRVLQPFRFPRTGHSIANRVVLAAMTNKQSHADGSLSDDELAWLAARASFGIVTTCAAHVARDGQGWDGELGVFDDALLPGLTRLAEALNAAGTTSLAQIFHGGVRAPSRLTGLQPWSASAFELDAPNFEPPRPATERDIEGAIAAFASAAVRCAAAGFDGVELHGAHGYLITQFLGTITNTREDEWGGSLERRARFVREILAAVKAAVPDTFLVGVRLSPEVPDMGVTLADSLQVARWLVEDGVDFLHVSNWDSFKPPAAHPDSDRPLTTWFRDAVGPEVPVIATGGVWTPAQADEVLAHGADMIGLARAAIGHARWPLDAATPGWEPQRPPYTADHLRANALGEAFIDYMRRWPDFVRS
ncbi:NADH:flavin oxidoreductase [Engelhardtia mirabilis]|uniref:NADH oxidase n=1 Tax=Engelhardtia mirabilis TaxID=2528011 RepID=A0A518BE95_9BACT|nr:NADH oxidase [Planctomycetes bacterium Pla133]QDU99634.1 NADH oxidase [Planctomycetes bacterium Pla86]